MKLTLKQVLHIILLVCSVTKIHDGNIIHSKTGFLTYLHTLLHAAQSFLRS